MARLTEPADIRLETPNYIMRSMVPDDAVDHVRAWLADPDIARLLNAPAQSVPEEQFRKYIESHDRIDSHIVGIFDRQTGEQLGFWAFYIDWSNKEFLVNTLIPGSPRGEEAISVETQRVLAPLVFDEFDLELLRCNVLSVNEKVRTRLAGNSFQPEHVSSARGVAGAPDVEVLHYSLPREVVRKLGFLPPKAESKS